MGPEDQIYDGIGALDPFGHVLLLDHAAADRDDLMRLGFFGVVEGTDIAQHTHLGVFTDGTGVHDDDIRLKLILRHGIAHFCEITAQFLTVGLILLAAVGVHHGEGPCAIGSDPVKDLMADGKLAVNFLCGDDGSLVFQGCFSVLYC